MPSPRASGPTRRARSTPAPSPSSMRGSWRGRDDGPRRARTWQALTRRGGEVALHAWLALAKDREHHLRDPAGALAAASEAERLLARRRALGLFMRDLEQDLPRRLVRLRRRLARAQPAAMDATAASVRSTSSAVL